MAALVGVAAVVLLLAQASSAAAACSAQAIGSDETILTHNDLYGL